LQLSDCVQAFPSLQVVANSQLPVPSQLPVLPQALEPAGEQVGGTVTRGAVPLGMFEQVPTLLDRLQLWQPSVQALSQQTPSTQNPLVQSVPTAH
jgi:hypothetical protein